MYAVVVGCAAVGCATACVTRLHKRAALAVRLCLPEVCIAVAGAETPAYDYIVNRAVCGAGKQHCMRCMCACVCVCDGCSAAAAAITGVLGEMRQLVQGGVCVNGARGLLWEERGLCCMLVSQHSLCCSTCV